MLKVSLKLQRFIDAKGKDIRAIVVGDQVSVAMERTSNKGDFRANISQNGSGRKIQLTESEIKICVDSAKACGLESAGVDIMKDASGKVFVCKVNGNPGTKIVDLTGHNYFADLIKLTETKVKEKKEADGKVAESTMDEKGLAHIQYKKRMCLYITKSEQELL